MHSTVERETENDEGGTPGGTQQTKEPCCGATGAPGKQDSSCPILFLHFCVEGIPSGKEGGNGEDSQDLSTGVLLALLSAASPAWLAQVGAR